ncbi:hypothetical protein ABEF95_010579 [Exophiala dermatitidis]
MPPRSRHTKSASIGSSVGDTSGADTTLNGAMLPPATPGSSTSSPLTARKPLISQQTTLPQQQQQDAQKPVVEIPSPSELLPSKKTTRKAAEAGKFTLTLVLSALLEGVFHTATAYVIPGDLALVSRRPDTAAVVGLLGWKIVKLALYWVRNFDAYDVASIELLLYTPQSILLGLFYQISPLTLAATTASHVLGNGIPYYFLRPLSPGHKPGSAPKGSLRNRPILTDPFTAIAISVLATSVFAVLLQTSFATFLPEWLVVHFVGLVTMEPAHRGPSGFPTLLLTLLPAGVALMEFLFAPSTAAGNVPVPPSEVFDPATASFLQHVSYNAWGWYTARQKALIARTTLLAVLIVTESVVQLVGGVAGVEVPGAVGYAGVWGLGVVILGAVLNWVGGPSD